MLDCLRLGAELGSSTVLDAKAQAEMNQQLLVGLALFKIERTRDSGLARLAGVGNVASILMHLEKSPLGPGQRQIVGAAMHGAVVKLASVVTAKAARDRLGILDHFLTTYDRFVKAADQSTLPTAVDEWGKVKAAGDKLVKATLDGLAADPDLPNLEDNVRRLGIVVANCNRLGAMPGAVKTAEQYKPKPAGGVERRLLLMARGIADTPEINGVQATEFDAFQAALGTLGAIHAAFPRQTPDTLMNKLSGDRYRQFIAKFLDSEQKLLTALATPNAPFAPLVAQLESEYALLRSVQDMLVLENAGGGGGNALTTLNAWGAWEVDPRACRRLIDLFDQALAAEFVAATAGPGTTVAPAPATTAAGTPLLSYADGKDALRNLADTVRRIAPALSAPPALPGGAAPWTSSYLQVVQWPTSQTALAGITEKLAVAEWLLNEAACDEANGQEALARPLLLKAVELLAGLDVAAEK